MKPNDDETWRKGMIENVNDLQFTSDVSHSIATANTSKAYP